MEITLEQVKQFFEANSDNEEVKAFTGSFVNKDSVESFLGTEDGKKFLQPKLDKNFTKGLETWKQNNLQTLIDAEINKKFPAETEEQKQLRTLQAKLDALEKEKTLATVKAEAMKEMTEKGLPANLVDFFVADSMEATRDKISVFEEIFKGALTDGINKEVDARFKDLANPPRNDGQTGQEGSMTKEKLMQLDYTERAKFYTENPTEYQRIMNS